MHDISRRSLLGALPILGSAFLALPAAATVGVAADDGPTLIEWDRLSEITQRLVVADYWRTLDPDQQREALRLMRASGQGRIADALGGAEFSGAGIYEFELRAGGVLIRPVAFLDRAPERDSPVERQGVSLAALARREVPRPRPLLARGQHQNHQQKGGLELLKTAADQRP